MESEGQRTGSSDVQGQRWTSQLEGAEFTLTQPFCSVWALWDWVTLTPVGGGGSSLVY